MNATNKLRDNMEREPVKSSFLFFWCAVAMVVLFIGSVGLEISMTTDIFSTPEEAGFFPAFGVMVLKVGMLLCMSIAVLLFRNDKGIDVAGSKGIFYPWAVAFAVILAGSFLPELYTFLMMGGLDLSIKQQMSENAEFLLMGAVLFCVVFLSYKMTEHKRFLRLLIADIAVCGVCAAVLPLPPASITDAAGNATLFGIAQIAAHYADYIIISANLFVAGSYCKLNESVSVNLR